MPMTISIDDDLKREFSEVCGEIGLQPSTAFGIFARTVVRERAIPFELRADARRNAAPAWEREAAQGIARGLAQFDEGDFLDRADPLHRFDGMDRT